MFGWLKALFCGHKNLVFIRNIHGEEIFLSGGKRSVWWCLDCGEAVYKDELLGKEKA